MDFQFGQFRDPWRERDEQEERDADAASVKEYRLQRRKKSEAEKKAKQNDLSTDKDGKTKNGNDQPNTQLNDQQPNIGQDQQQANKLQNKQPDQKKESTEDKKPGDVKTGNGVDLGGMGGVNGGTGNGDDGIVPVNNQENKTVGQKVEAPVFHEAGHLEKKENLDGNKTAVVPTDNTPQKSEQIGSEKNKEKKSNKKITENETTQKLEPEKTILAEKTLTNTQKVESESNTQTTSENKSEKKENPENIKTEDSDKTKVDIKSALSEEVQKNVQKSSEEEVEVEAEKKENTESNNTESKSQQGAFLTGTSIEEELASLFAVYEGNKKRFKSITKGKEAAIQTKANQEKKNIDSEFAKQSSEVSGAYDLAISRVSKSVTSAKNKTEKSKKQQTSSLQKNAEFRAQGIDTTTVLKQGEVKQLGDSYARQAKNHALDKMLEAEKKRYENKTTIQQNADDAKNAYKNHEYYADVKEAVNDSAEEYYENIDESTDDLNETLVSDSKDLAEKFIAEASDTSSKLPQGKDAAKLNIASIYKEGIKQINGIAGKPLSELQSRTNKVIESLKQDKKKALDLLRKQRDDAYQQIEAEASKGKKALSDQEKVNLDEISSVVNDTQTECATLRPEYASQLILSAKERLTTSETSLSKAQDEIIKQCTISLRTVGKTAKTGLSVSAKAEKNHSSEVASNAESGADKTASGIEESYVEIVGQMCTMMDSEVERYTIELDKMIAKSLDDWDNKLAEGKKGMNDKASQVFDENAKTVKESRQSLFDTAKDASEVSIWDVLSAIGYFILGVLAVIGAILLLILIVFLLAEIGIALLGWLLAVLAETAFASLLTLALTALELFVAEFLVSTAYLFVIVGVGIGVKKIVDTSNNKNLTRDEKAYGYGQGTADILLSILPFWAEIKGFFRGANTIAEEEALLNATREATLTSNIEQQGKNFLAAENEARTGYKDFDDFLKAHEDNLYNMEQAEMEEMMQIMNKLEDLKNAAPRESGQFDNALREIEDIILQNKIRQNSQKEVAVLTDTEGNVIRYKLGEHNRVDVRDWIQEGIMEGNVFTHNHPNSSSLSLADIKIAMKNNIQQIRATGKEGTYLINRPPNGWNVADDFDIVYAQKMEEFTNIAQTKFYSPKEIDFYVYQEMKAFLIQEYNINIIKI